MKLPSLLLWLFSYSVLTLANTEIVNFEALDSGYAEIPQAIGWTILHPQQNERTLSILSVPLKKSQDPQATEGIPRHNEIWLRLALDEEEWKSFSKFTLRVSWPANYPTDFSIDILSPEAVALHFSSAQVLSNTTLTTRVKYVRITAVHTGVIVPALSHIQPKPVPFVVILESLYFGVLPASVVPIIGFLALILPGVWFVAKKVMASVESIAEEARKELEATNEDKRK
ncbi:hypothetical protein L218DRAFT_906524 [Marasmius fiardii PR-910]|nr:hypothetical protein L218DRAFT_906524 [Marasmius fiardii PR-910]